MLRGQPPPAVHRRDGRGEEFAAPAVRREPEGVVRGPRPEPDGAARPRGAAPVRGRADALPPAGVPAGAGGRGAARVRGAEPCPAVHAEPVPGTAHRPPAERLRRARGYPVRRHHQPGGGRVRRGRTRRGDAGPVRPGPRPPRPRRVAQLGGEGAARPPGDRLRRDGRFRVRRRGEQPAGVGDGVPAADRPAGGRREVEGVPGGGRRVRGRQAGGGLLQVPDAGRAPADRRRDPRGRRGRSDGPRVGEGGAARPGRAEPAERDEEGPVAEGVRNGPSRRGAWAALGKFRAALPAEHREKMDEQFAEYGYELPGSNRPKGTKGGKS